MKQLVLGAYSYYLSSEKQFYEAFFDKELAPLFRLLYENEQYKFTLFLTSAELDWMAEKRSEEAKLMSILLKRGSISLLSSALYQAFVPVATLKQISDQLEAMRVKIRQNFHYKSTGFFVFSGVWQTELSRLLSKSDISHIVIPSQRKGDDLPQSFLMWEHGNKLDVIAPKASTPSLNVGDYLPKNLAANDFEAMFFNIDYFVKDNKSFFEFMKTLLIEYCDKGGFNLLTSDCVKSDEVSYLPSGCYCEDEKFLQRIYEDKKNLIKLARINYIENLSLSKNIKKSELANISRKAMKIYTGSQFIKGYLSPEDERDIYKTYLDVLKDLSEAHASLPEFDMLIYTLEVVKNKNNLFLLDQKCASIREVGDFKTGVNLLSSARLLEDVITIKNKNDSHTYHSYNQFEVTMSKTTRNFTMYQYHCSNFCDINIEIDKSITIKNSREIDLEVVLKNNNAKKIDFAYSLLCEFDNIKDISTPEKCNTIFNVYLENDKKKSITFTSQPGFYMSQAQKNSLLPSWNVGIETGKSFKIDFKITF